MTRNRFGLFPFRSPLLRESRLLSFPVGTEMFHFPTFPPPALCVQAGAMGHYALSGFPIRRSPGRSLVADLPGLIAGSYVLLRLLVPRHPPCALISLATTDDARVHCAVLKIRAVPALHRGHPRARYRSWRGPSEPVHDTGAAVPSGPNSVLGPLAPLSGVPAASDAAVLAGPAMTLGPNNQCSTNELPPQDCAGKRRSLRHGSGRCPTDADNASCSLERR
jgi:hypothetical protein